jgi:hypothetical protein
LPDGNYLLRIHADKVHANGYDHDGNGDKTAGDDFTFGATAADKFFRLFGDQDGDRDVDATDRYAFLRTRGSSQGASNYLWFFDYDGSGTVDSSGTDATQFNSHYGKKLSFGKELRTAWQCTTR